MDVEKARLTQLVLWLGFRYRRPPWSPFWLHVEPLLTIRSDLPSLTSPPSHCPCFDPSQCCCLHEYLSLPLHPGLPNSVASIQEVSACPCSASVHVTVDVFATLSVRSYVLASCDRFSYVLGRTWQDSLHALVRCSFSNSMGLLDYCRHLR